MKCAQWLACCSSFALLATLLVTAPAVSQDATTMEESPWFYTLKKPVDGWERTDFNAAGWQEGIGGFGTRGTPGARVGTEWRTNDIWLRQHVDLPKVPSEPALLIHHDEDVQVYINGMRVASLEGYTSEYEVVKLTGEGRGSLKPRDNVLAVHCSQTRGGQFIDVLIIDANHVPKLPQPKRSTVPFKSELITEWGASVNSENAWSEYPRPALVRSQWQNLNGHWDYAVAKLDQQKSPEAWDGQILVPFCLESKLSGVQRLLDASKSLWYRRSFDADPVDGKRTLLHFEAVDYRCEVWVNGKRVGEHVGGFTPFHFDVTDALRAGPNELVVRVEDETEGDQLRGKQVLDARGIWYTQVSGIWQTVWTENVPESHIEKLKIASDAKAGTITVRAIVSGDAKSLRRRVIVKDGDRQVAEVTGADEALTVQVTNPKLWSPRSPHLYDLEITLVDAQGNAVDTVQGYAGIRTVGRVQDGDGNWRFTLNGEVIFHWGPLDQGWWPDGLLTPPSDEGMRYDIEQLKAAGFNMIRKHIKVEPRRYYYHCDRLGMMMWQDQVSGGRSPEWTRMRRNPTDADWTDENHSQFMLELERMVDSLENHPCIVVWVPFNEAWGQHKTVDVGKWTVDRDPSRLVNIASGGNFWPVGDVADHHSYPHPSFPLDDDRYADFIKVVGEFGGHGYPVPGHLWDASRDNWGYGGLPKSKEEYKERYAESIRIINDLRKQGIAGGVYTQTTDVEGEINGLLTYDRKVIKIPTSDLQEVHSKLFEQ
ncbi:MAG: hypothetical protein KDA60_14025 [Planctomycetales bacterium]|nr:hypothetical protein [Planctomycetales bacterium]